MSIYTCVCIFRVRAPQDSCSSKNASMYTDECLHLYVYVYVHIYIYRNVYGYMYVCVWVRICRAHAPQESCPRSWARSRRSLMECGAWHSDALSCVHDNAESDIHTHTHTHTYTHTHTHIHTHTPMSCVT